MTHETDQDLETGDDFVTGEDHRSPAERAQQNQIDQFEELLGVLHPNTTILIERLLPSWCAGVLEEITLTETIGISYFIETWGGHLLSIKIRGRGGKLKGGYKLPLFSYPPLLFGKKLKPNDLADKFREDDPVIQPNPHPVVVPPAPNQFEKLFAALPAVLPLVFDYLRSQDEKRQNDMQMMIQMMKGNNSSGLSDITKVGAAMTQLNEMFRSNNFDSGNNGGGEMDFLPHALDVLKLALDKKPAPKQAKPKITPPPPVPQRLTQPPKSPILTQTQSQNVNVSAEISKMNPDEAANAVIAALGQMSPDKRNAAMGAFLTQYQDDMGDEGGGEFDDYEDDNQRGDDMDD